MSKILEEIKNLQEAFISLLETEGESTLELTESVHGAIEKYVKDPKKKEELHNKAFDIQVNNDVDQINRIEKNLKGAKTGEEAWNKAWDIHNRRKLEKISKNIKGDSKTDARSGILRANPNVERDNDEFREREKEYRREHLKMNDNNSYNSTMQQILDLTEAYANLLETNDKRGGAQKEVNKITRTKRDKNGEPIEVVSVADELFPYKGTAKEQYNQKILAKINDMIEGTATLDDLIQLVRSKKPAVNVKESLQETLDKMMAVTEEIINEKNANKAKRKAYEINQAERKQGELEYDPFYRKDARSVKYANQNTIRELKKIKPTNYTQGQALKSAQLSLAQQTRDTLGREDHPENPYKKPFVWAKGYKNLYGNLNQKAFERKGYGNLKIKKDSNSPVKDLVKTSIEQEKKIKPNLPKPVKESLQETLDKMMAVAEAIKDNVRYHFTGTLDEIEREAAERRRRTRKDRFLTDRSSVSCIPKTPTQKTESDKQ